MNSRMPADWKRMRFKKNKVWMAVDTKGVPLEDKGRLLIKYQLEQDHEYWVNKANVTPIDEPEKQKPPPKGTATGAPRSTPKSRPAPQAPELTEAGMPENAIFIYTDGASSGNPGPSGIGVVMRHLGREKDISRYIGHATNNVAELEAIRAGLEAVRNRSLPVRLFTDSSYAHGVFSLGWKAKKNTERIGEIQALVKKFRDLKFFKVKGHSGHEWNDRADALATAAIRDNRNRVDTQTTKAP